MTTKQHKEPCPFCGSKSIRVLQQSLITKDYLYINCNCCDTRGPLVNVTHLATDKEKRAAVWEEWNRRPQMVKLKDRIVKILNECRELVIWRVSSSEDYKLLEGWIESFKSPKESN
jgi:Lar family restriction alleviation protein